MHSWINLALLLTSTWARATAQSYDNYSSLFSTLLEGYNPDIRPVSDQSSPLTINVFGHIYSLINVDIVQGKITVFLTLIVEWTDSQIHWTPSEFGNLSNVLIPRSRVWSPAFALGTSIEFSKIGEPWMPIKYHSDGFAEMYSGEDMSSGCAFNVKFWPFDKQVCEIGFFVYGYDLAQIRLQTPSSNAFYTFILNENIEWDVTSATSYVRDDRGISEVILRLEIARRSGIYVILIIFPLYGIACLTPFVFILPSESGERIGFSTTVTLSLTVFLDVISDYIPNASTPLPLLCIVVTMGVSMSLTCTLAVILSLYVYHKDERIPVRGFVAMFVKIFNSNIRNSKIKPESQLKTKHDDSFMNRPSMHNTNDLMIKELTCKPEDVAEKITTSGDTKISTSYEVEISWKDVSYTIDKVCFIGGIIFHAGTFICLTCYMALGSN